MTDELFNKDLIEVVRKEFIQKIESALSLPSDFLTNLPFDDDWSFVIKLHALIEGSTSILLNHHFNASDSCEIFNNLEMSNHKTGKIAFLKSFHLLSNEHRTFIAKLSELRNLLVHNPRNISFDLKVFLNDDSMYNKFAELFFYGQKPKNFIIEKEKVLNSPKTFMYHGGIEILFTCWSKISLIDSKAYFKDIARKKNINIDEYFDFENSLFKDIYMNQ